MAFKTSPCFVDSVWEVFGPLLAGVPLVTVPPAVMRDSAQVGGGSGSRGGRWQWRLQRRKAMQMAT